MVNSVSKYPTKNYDMESLWKGENSNGWKPYPISWWIGESKLGEYSDFHAIAKAIKVVDEEGKFEVMRSLGIDGLFEYDKSPRIINYDKPQAWLGIEDGREIFEVVELFLKDISDGKEG